MSIFIDPTGEPTYGIGICARCSKKMPLAKLSPDPNSPGLMVCDADRDEFDPYRLPARQVENITLPFTRPDVPLTGFAPDTVYALGLNPEWGNYLLTEDELVIILEGI